MTLLSIFFYGNGPTLRLESGLWAFTGETCASH